MGKGVIQGEFLGEGMFPGGLKMADDDLFIKVHVGGSAALGSAMEEVGVEAGENEELVRALYVDEEAFVRAGVLQSFDVVDAVKAVEFAGGKPLLGCGRQSEVCTDDGDVVGYLEVSDTGLHECVADDGEEEHLGREHRSPAAHDHGFEELWMIEDHLYRFGVIEK
jgi:hypothetical protein